MIVVGTFPVVALMVGNAVTRISAASSVCDDSSFSNSTTASNSSSNTSSSAVGQEESDPCFQDGCEVLAVDVAVTLSFLVGILMVKAMLLLAVYACYTQLSCWNTHGKDYVTSSSLS